MIRNRWFSASYDTTTRVVTGLFGAVMLVVSLVVHIVVIPVLACAVLVLGYAWSPRAYSVSGGAIRVRRLIGTAVISLSELRDIRRSGPDDLTGCIRLFGSGGLFGYYGLFRTSRLGKCTWYLTNRANIVVAIGPRTALFSPDDVDGFLGAVRASAPHLDASDPTAFDVVTYRSSGVPMTALILGSLALFTILLVSVSSRYAPGPEKYTLADRRLFIQDRFYPITLGAADVDSSAIRLVDIASDPQWHITLRANGIGMQHYNAGWFRVANGTMVLMYRTGSRRLVLIPARGSATTVLLEVADPAEFIDRLKREFR